MGILKAAVVFLAIAAGLTVPPAEARFLQTDPIGSKDDLDLYAYVGGDPIGRTDPSGNGPGVVAGAEAGAAAGLACGPAAEVCSPVGAAVGAAAGYVAEKALVTAVSTAVVAGVAAATGVLNKSDNQSSGSGATPAAAPTPVATPTPTAPNVPTSVGPGSHAGDSIPAGPSPTPTKEQQGKINDIGNDTGCHTCGTKDPGTRSGNFVGDHQPPTALNPPGNPQVYLPQCLPCSNTQGGIVSGLVRGQ